MPRSTRIRRGGIIFLPITTTYPKWKIEVNGEDITAFVSSAQVNLVATHRISYAIINIDNDKGRYNNKWNPDKESVTIDIFFDYALADSMDTHVPENKIYSGKLDSVRMGLTNQGYIMELKSRDRPELFDMTTTIEFDNETVDNALRAVIDDLNTQAGYTVLSYSSSIEETAIQTSANFKDTRYITILSDLCDRADFDSRIDSDGLFNAFTRGSQECLRESIASGQNLLACPPTGKDGTEIKNFIKTYGSEVESCLIMWTKESTTPLPWRKDMIVNDTSIENLDQVKDRADKEYNNKVDAEIKGSPSCIGLPYLLPGQAIRTFVEYCELNDFYVASQVSHILSMGGVDTRVTLSELEKDGLRIIKDNERDIREKATFNNPNGMEKSYHFTFDGDTKVATHSNTKTFNGKLSLVSGQDNGTMISNALTVETDPTFAEIRFNGNDDCDLSIFKVSFDDGENYTTITPGTKGEPGPIFPITDSSKKIRVSVNLISSAAKTTPEIESLVVLFK